MTKAAAERSSGVRHCCKRRMVMPSLSKRVTELRRRMDKWGAHGVRPIPQSTCHLRAPRVFKGLAEVDTFKPCNLSRRICNKPGTFWHSEWPEARACRCLSYRGISLNRITHIRGSPENTHTYKKIRI